MKSHLLRPLWVVIIAVALLLVVRQFMVPPDFGVHGKSFTYNFYRLGNVEEWKEFPVKYRGNEFCVECHEENSAANKSSKHKILQCENCHGPAFNHPEEPELLVIDTSRDLCLRCHAYLPYPTSLRAQLPGIAPNEHNPDSACSDCHNPHKPDLEDMS